LGKKGGERRARGVMKESHVRDEHNKGRKAVAKLREEWNWSREAGS